MVLEISGSSHELYMLPRSNRHSILLTWSCVVDSLIPVSPFENNLLVFHTEQNASEPKNVHSLHHKESERSIGNCHPL